MVIIRKCSQAKLFSAIEKHNISIENYGYSGYWHSASYAHMQDGDKPKRAYLAKDKGGVVGWAVTWDNDENHVYVIPKYRGRGIGTRFVKILEKREECGGFCPWDDYTISFFEKRTKKIHRNYA